MTESIEAPGTFEEAATAEPGVSRGSFLRNAAAGGIALVAGGGLLASVEGVAIGAEGPTKSDIETLQAAYIAESLAVVVYRTVLKNYNSFKRPLLRDTDLDRKYLVGALRNEREHRQFLAEALGRNRPRNLKFRIPPNSVKTGKALLRTGVALESAFVQAYLGASNTLSSPDLRLVAAKVAANEATHFGFFNAAAGGRGVLPSLPETATIPQTVRKLQPFLG